MNDEQLRELERRILEPLLNRTIESVRDIQKDMTDSQRKDFWDKLQEGYCKFCGRDDHEMPQGCQCWNDE